MLSRFECSFSSYNQIEMIWSKKNSFSKSVYKECYRLSGIKYTESHSDYLISKGLWIECTFTCLVKIFFCKVIMVIFWQLFIKLYEFFEFFSMLLAEFRYCIPSPIDCRLKFSGVDTVSQSIFKSFEITECVSFYVFFHLSDINTKFFWDLERKILKEIWAFSQDLLLSQKSLTFAKRFFFFVFFFIFRIEFFEWHDLSSEK